MQKKSSLVRRPLVLLIEQATKLALVKAQHEKARKILTDNRAKLDELAKFLLCVLLYVLQDDIVLCINCYIKRREKTCQFPLFTVY